MSLFEVISVTFSAIIIGTIALSMIVGFVVNREMRQAIVVMAIIVFAVLGIGALWSG